MELETFTHLSGKYFYSLLMQSIPHLPTDAIKPAKNRQPILIFLSRLLSII
jgi:hypothetical protein